MPPDRPETGRGSDNASPASSPVPGSADAAGPGVWTVELDDPAARDADLAGGKAAALSVAATAGLRTLPGFVLPPAAVDALHGPGEADLAVLRRAWARLSRDGEVALVVRSSSLAEDRSDDAMAGQFESVGDVRGWDAFVDALHQVARSRDRAADQAAAEAPMAVLVQPMLDMRRGGVLFGLDPVTGREDRVVVSVVSGRPDELVSGDVEGTRYVLTPDGSPVERRQGAGGARLPRADLRRLARLARRGKGVFGGPQDIEWGLDQDGYLYLLQSRPVTTQGRGRPVGPVLGRGPVAETFPEPLSLLERDLWLAPLRDGVAQALRLAAVVPRKELRRSPVVSAVGGHAAMDLELLGPRRDSGFWRRLDPRPGVRRLRASWRVGRLRSALPVLVDDLLDRTDRELRAVPDVDQLTSRQLVALLETAGHGLTALHAHEILVGVLLDPESTATPATGAAMRVLNGLRAEGVPDDEIVRRHPVVLALAPPRVGRVALPEETEPATDGMRDDGDELALRREALRMRGRWLQELTARAAAELGERLAAIGQLDQPLAVRHVDLAALEQVVWHPERVRLHPVAEPEPEEPPATFRMSDTGRTIAETGRTDTAGAGGGRGTGVVTHDAQDPPPDSVLVVATLQPSLAAVLPRLAGLVAETGDPLAHLAILARQAGVPCVVGYGDALGCLEEGVAVEVDGDAGTVRRTDEKEPA